MASQGQVHLLAGDVRWTLVHNKEGKERKGVVGPCAPGSKAGFRSSQRPRVLAASQQGAQAEPCYSCRVYSYAVVIGLALEKQVLGLGRKASPHWSGHGRPQPHTQPCFPSRLYASLYLVHMFILAGKGLGLV